MADKPEARKQVVLKTNAEKCKVCKIGDVKIEKNSRKQDENFIIYTRNGTLVASHQTYRCNNFSLPCRAGHYYGYVSVIDSKTNETSKCYEKFALKNEFLVTSSQTAFEVFYLYDCILQILHSNASFESLSKVYSDLHFTNNSLDDMHKRVEAHKKRLSEAILTYLYLELGQRYEIPTIITGGIDKSILANKDYFHQKFQELWAEDHECNVKGCKDVITIDSGMKPI